MKSQGLFSFEFLRDYGMRAWIDDCFSVYILYDN
jgi:hypothetical protein